MRIRRRHYLLASLLLGPAGLGAYFLLRGENLPPRPEDPLKTTPVAAVKVPDVTFTDVTEAAGIRFRHFNGATGKKLLPETMGSGVAVLDFDRDSNPDLFFLNSCAWPGCPKPEGGSRLALYRNKGDGTFEDVTEAAGLALTIFGMGVAVGDIDNDGYPDVFITAMGGNFLFHNVAGHDGQRRFQDITKDAKIGGPSILPEGSADDFYRSRHSLPWPNAATFLDYDGDGQLDLFVCYYLDWSPGLDLASIGEFPALERSYVPPTRFPGTNCALFRNVDGLHFEDVSEKAGIHVFHERNETSLRRPKQPVGKALGVIVCDPDEDGWPDLVVANDTERNFLFHNVPGAGGGRRFEEIGLLANVAYADQSRPRGAMGIDWAEYAPGKRALFIATYADEPDTFLMLDDAKDLHFVDIAQRVGLEPGTPPLKFGAFFFDYDLDGRMDLLTCNGHIDPDVAKANARQRYAQATQLFWNTGQSPRLYAPVAEVNSGGDLFRPMVGRGCAYLDFDGDGDLDVVLTENNGPARLLRNDNRLNNHWIRLELIGDGKHSTRDAIGADVTIEAGGGVQRRYLSGAKSYLSQCEHVMTIGLGKLETVDRITVRWSGKNEKVAQKWHGLAGNRTYELRQGERAAKPLPQSR